MILIVLIIAVTFILYAAYLFFKPSLTGPAAKDKITVSLVELSSVWTKYNQEVKAAPVSKNLDEEDLAALNKLEEEELKATMGDAAVVPGIPNTATQKKEAANPASQDGSHAQEKQGRTPQPAPEASQKNILNEFIEDFITPHKHVFEQQKVLDVVKQLIEIMMKHGDVPSIVLDNKDIEAINLNSVKDNLARTTLKEHSCHVGIILMNMIKDAYGAQYDQHVPKAVIAALGHDIGKIPEYRLSGIYNSTEHVQVSAQKINELFFGKEVFWARDIGKSITEHHIFNATDQFTQLLIAADKQAREQELLKYAKDFSIKTIKDWFKPETFMWLIEPYINVTQGNKWQSFSYNNIIYCRPDAIYDTAKKMCREEKILDLAFVYEADKEKSIKIIVAILREAGYVSDILKVNCLGMKFQIFTSHGQTHQYVLTPLKAEPIMSKIAEIERRKIGFLEVITAVKLKDIDVS